MNKLTKTIAGISTTLSLLYWTALPTLAAPVLCPTQGGITPPGCGGKVPGVQDIISFIVNVLLFAAFVIALVFLIIGGIRWILSGGDKEATAKAKSTVTSALIGLAVVLAAWILINIILQILTGQGLSNIAVPSLQVPGT